MRKIKFRGKEKVTGKWIYGSLFVDGSGTTFILIPRPAGDWEQDLEKGGLIFVFEKVIMVEVDPKTVGQYVGRKDKNNVEIYRGDIIELNWENEFVEIYTRGIVEWVNFSFTTKNFVNKSHYKRSNRPLDEYWSDNSLLYRDVVIQGNIWDNPELLKGRKRK